MGFLSYSYLIFLISGQTSEVTVAHEKFWKLNSPLISLISDQIAKSFYEFFFAPNQTRMVDVNLFTRSCMAG